jgi:hypothetical protein
MAEEDRKEGKRTVGAFIS